MFEEPTIYLMEYYHKFNSDAIVPTDKKIGFSIDLAGREAAFNQPINKTNFTVGLRCIEAFKIPSIKLMKQHERGCHTLLHDRRIGNTEFFEDDPDKNTSLRQIFIDYFSAFEYEQLSLDNIKEDKQATKIRKDESEVNNFLKEKLNENTDYFERHVNKYIYAKKQDYYVVGIVWQGAFYSQIETPGNKDEISSDLINSLKEKGYTGFGTARDKIGNTIVQKGKLYCKFNTWEEALDNHKKFIDMFNNGEIK